MYPHGVLLHATVVYPKCGRNGRRSEARLARIGDGQHVDGEVPALWAEWEVIRRRTDPAGLQSALDRYGRGLGLNKG